MAVRFRGHGLHNAHAPGPLSGDVDPVAGPQIEDHAEQLEKTMDAYNEVLTQPEVEAFEFGFPPRRPPSDRRDAAPGAPVHR